MLPLSGVLFCSDLDGTLTGPNDTISVRNVQAIRRFCALGGRFTISTGRFPDFIRPFMKAHPGIITAPLVSMNGALVYDLETDRTLCVRPLLADAVPVLGLCQEHPGLKVIHMHQMSGTWEWRGDAESYERLGREPLLKAVIVWNSPDEAETAQRAMTERYGSSFDILRSWPFGVELLDPAGGKGNGMDFLRKELPGIRCIASAGDFENDLPMFEHSDYSFAPGNAMETVRNAVTHPMAEKNTQDFIAAALEKLEELLTSQEV